MATKEQVLPLLELGLTPQQIAKKLKCSDAYVRAVRAREFGNGKDVYRKYDRRKYWSDPDFYRAASRERSQKSRERRKAEQSASA